MNFPEFKFWCYHTMPLVYDDSLSYMELLCKFKEHLNKFIEDYNTEINAINARLDAGGFNTTIVQTTGDSTTDVMSQKACTESFMPIGGGSGGDFMANGTVPMTGNLNMGSHKIINVTTPTNNTDAANKQYVDTHTSTGTGDFMANGTVPMTGNLNVNNNKVINVADPTTTKDAANKIYVDKHIGGNVLDVSVAPVNGQIIKFDGSTNKWIYSAETGGGTGGGGDFLSNGSVPMTGNLNMNSNKIVNVAAPTANSDAANKEYVDNNVGGGFIKADGTVPMAANLDMGIHKITHLDPPTTGLDAVNKTYADSNILGMGITEEHTFPRNDGDVLRWKESNNGWIWYPIVNQTYINNHIAGKDIDSALTPADGQIIKWNEVQQKWIYANELGSGSGVGNVVQTLGYSENDVMSQNATTRWALWAPADNDFDATETRPIMSSYILHPELINYGGSTLSGFHHWYHKLIGEQGSRPWNTITGATKYMEGFPIPMYNGEAAGDLGLMADEIFAKSSFSITKMVDEYSRHALLSMNDTNINAINKPIINVTAPTNNTDAANKKYVDDADATVKSYGNTHIAGKTAPTGTPTAGQTITWDATNSKWVYSTPSGGGGTYTLPMATASALGGIMAAARNASTETQEVKIDSTSGKLYVKPPGTSSSYTLPKATASALGGVMANAAQSTDTQEVRIDANGFLKTAPGSGGGTGGLQPVTVTRDSAYISTPTNNNTTKVLADPTAPPARPIQAGQIAVYSTTNQTYNTADVGATLLVADPHSDMEAVNKRTNDTKLAKANINDSFKRITAVQGSNPGAESYHILAKNANELGEDRIPVYSSQSELIVGGTFKSPTNFRFNVNNTNLALIVALNSITSYYNLQMSNKKITSLANPTSNTDAANKQYVDGFIETDLPAPGQKLSDNTIYKITTAQNSYTFTPPDTGWAHGTFTTDTAPAITFPAGSKFANAVPTFEANTEYEFDVYDKVWVFTKVVTA